VPDGPTVLGTVGGPSIATATGVLLGAANRRLPVLIDGPVAVAAAMAAREYGTQVRLWCLLLDAGTDPTVRLGADRLGVTPLLDVGLGLGEGAGALALLPTLQAALGVAALDTA
jgi:NaMN:DMB phosphoribosyltransferase